MACLASVRDSTAESLRLLSLLASLGLMRADGPSAKGLMCSGLCPAAPIKDHKLIEHAMQDDSWLVGKVTVKGGQLFAVKCYTGCFHSDSESVKPPTN